MSRNLNFMPLFTAILFVVLSFISDSAFGVVRNRDFAQNATGNCQSALPVFDGQIRKRPLAIQNEGSAPAFVTCSFLGTFYSIGGTQLIVVHAINHNSSATNISCTLVDGYIAAEAQYFTKTITIPPNGGMGYFNWERFDNGGNNFNYVTNMSCNLPVGTGLAFSVVVYDEDVGD